MKKKERVFAAIRKEAVDHVPTGFSLHFPGESQQGEEAVKAHLQFFRETDTDIIKIMNENLVPDAGDILRPKDWDKIPSYSLKDGFMQAQLEMVKRIMDSMESVLRRFIR